MANETVTPAPEKKKRKPQGPRVNKPIFALVSLRDDEGNPVSINKKNLTIKLERDAAAILERAEAGDLGSTIFVKVDLPVATTNTHKAGAV